MKKFLFEGELGASKSLYNRALIVSSFNPAIKIIGTSQSDDIDLMKEAIGRIGVSKEFDCGQAGTVLRFLSIRLAREKGIFKLRGSARLMGRLRQELQQTLSQLGTESRLLDECTLELDCDSWRPRGDGLWIPSGKTSQFASAILLSAWNLDSPIHFVRSGEIVSDSYFQMSLELVRAFGMTVDVFGQEVSIQAKQAPMSCSYSVECDVSSAFAIAALASLAGSCWIKNFPERSLQPDSIFISHLIRMGVHVEQSKQGLRVSKGSDLQAINVDFRNSPDLFPVLAILCSFATGKSHFEGLNHLEHKESDRVKRIMELSTAMGASWSGSVDSALVLEPPRSLTSEMISFDADEDHRLVMAAAVAQAGGCQIELSGQGCISKSFKDFQQIWSRS